MNTAKATADRGCTGDPGAPAARASHACPARLAHVAALRLRPASASDQRPLEFFFDALLRRDYFLRRGQLAEMLRGERHQVLIAEIDAVLVGVAVLTRGARLVNVLVHPAYRGLGIGRALVERSAAREVRAKLDVSAGDPRGFYRRLGFASTGRRNGKGNIEILRRPDATPVGGRRPAHERQRAARRGRKPRQRAPIQEDTR